MIKIEHVYADGNKYYALLSIKLRIDTFFTEFEAAAKTDSSTVSFNVNASGNWWLNS